MRPGPGSSTEQSAGSSLASSPLAPQRRPRDAKLHREHLLVRLRDLRAEGNLICALLKQRDVHRADSGAEVAAVEPPNVLEVAIKVARRVRAISARGRDAVGSARAPVDGAQSVRLVSAHAGRVRRPPAMTIGGP